MPPEGTQHQIPVIELAIEEDLDADGMSRLGALIDDAVRLEPAELVVDLTDCQFIDAAFIGLLVDAHRQVRRRGGLLTLRSPSPRLRRNIRLARVDRVLDLTPTTDPTTSA
jgi:anti-anti-sigma factor